MATTLTQTQTTCGCCYVTRRSICDSILASTNKAANIFNSRDKKRTRNEKVAILAASVSVRDKRDACCGHLPQIPLAADICPLLRNTSVQQPSAPSRNVTLHYIRYAIQLCGHKSLCLVRHFNSLGPQRRVRYVTHLQRQLDIACGC